MSRGNGGGRVRVVIAGNIYTKRALVKRFLEDDGFRVVAEVKTRPELSATLETSDPDAVVVDADLLAADQAAITAIRRKAPEAKIVVFKEGPEEEPGGADGYLEKGVGLAALTSLLGLLCSDPAVPHDAVPPAGTLAAATEALGTLSGRESSGEGSLRAPHTVLRAGAVAIAAVIILVLASALFSGGEPPIGHPLATPSSGPSVDRGPTILQLAQSDLSQLRDALAGGSYTAARELAESLMLHRSAAIDEGLSVSALDQLIGARLSPLMGSLAPRVIPFLQDVLGALLPPIPTSGGGGGPTITGGGGNSTSGSTSGIGGTGGGTGTGVDGDDGGRGTGDDGDEFPGQGKHLGWAHKPPQGGWHGHKPK